MNTAKNTAIKTDTIVMALRRRLRQIFRQASLSSIGQVVLNGYIPLKYQKNKVLQGLTL